MENGECNNELTAVSGDIPNVVTNLLNTMLHQCDEKVKGMAQRLERSKPSIQKELAERSEEQKRVIEARVNEKVQAEGSSLAAEFNNEMPQLMASYDKDKTFLSQQSRDLKVKFNQLEVAPQAKTEIEAHCQAKID